MQQPGSLGCLLTLLCALLLGIEQEGVGPRAPEHHLLQSQPILPCPGELPQNTSSAHQSARTVLDTSTPPWEKISRAQYRPTSNFQVIHVSRSLRLNVQHHFHSISSCWDQFKVWYPNFQVIGASVWQLLYVYWKINLFSADPSENLLGWVQLWIPLKLKFWDGLRNQYALDQAFSSLLNFPFFAGKQFTN